MRIIQGPDNGNVTAANRNGVASHRNADNRSWLLSNNTRPQNTTRTTHDDHNKNCNNVFQLDSTEIKDTNLQAEDRTCDVTIESGVCNRQYRINKQKIFSNSCQRTITDKLEQDNNVIYNESSPDTTPLDEEKTFENSDTDEMSENIVHPVPRGIVNPNYPGFQHLAHTLQDYSTNIETFYQSENEMTDDDLDTEIIDATCQLKTTDAEINLNNNLTNYKSKEVNQLSDLQSKTSSSDDAQNDIPDLLKTVSNNNNTIESFNYDCSATDIENNFHTKDIIGDFNKEIEDEIKHLLNYNINIQDDLEELRKDIKDTFAKPIENTINNISDVMNHVIKKLVETQSDGGENTETDLTPTTYNKEREAEELNNVNKDNEKNRRTEMNLSRPTFLLIENHSNNKIQDAILSDGKDEINIYEHEYDTEALSHNVENTIKQLSTELRKIIPKLNEMRERDRLWNENIKETASVMMDKNSNEISNLSSSLAVKCNGVNYTEKVKQNKYQYSTSSKCRKNSTILPNAKKACSDRYSSQATAIKSPTTQNTASVRTLDNAKEYDLDSFDVYNIETALPKIDLDAIESHLKAAKEAERRKRNDREEIRKRLAMDADSEEYYSLGHTDRPGKKPSLHSRLQNGKNLQICFMNETASDNESQASDIEKNLKSSSKTLPHTSIFGISQNHPYQTRPLSVNITKNDSAPLCGPKLRQSPFTLKTTKSRSTQSLNHIDIKETDFYALQARLQTEARIALAQAKEMAHIQMERERHSRAVSPVTEMLRRSMEKANAPLAPDRRRVSRQLLTDMNIAQLQVIVNELHSQIESLNDSLVKLLMARDELHMGQDSMLVDIEDLTRYLGVKEQTKKTKGTAKSGVRRLTSLVNK
ncbi:schwannomin-interacting protein 1 homolog isoform X1 [Papilio machaon]|uniref:schwannomin-interacting protein 1 homolog isoform X1 n=1 Tax=Papilio machaon TaxID=76193 RepID=UPI001E665F40|nr:schwannomin-interacting protein 1 homolog isoform X1 [Papilio machaon]XP_014370137.2 schwannomin-interacting protein 1 homolog isoform X1 [Papilio machaon]